jgi:hypothetical protein
MEPVRVPWLIDLLVTLFFWRFVAAPAFEKTLQNLKQRIEAAAA